MTRAVVGFAGLLALGVIACSGTSDTGPGGAGGGGQGGMGGDAGSSGAGGSIGSGGTGGSAGGGGGPGRVFPCSEAGVRNAITVPGGPHTFACATPEVLTMGAELVIDTNVILDGLDYLTIDGGGNHRAVSIAPDATVGLIGLVITGGASSKGGGIYNEGTLTLVGTTVSANTAAEDGGGIYNEAGATLTSRNCTASGNAAEGRGGGIYGSSGATSTWFNSTVSDNLADDLGAGVYSEGQVELTNVTVSGNGIAHDGAGNRITFANTIVDGTCSGTGDFESRGGNVESPGNGCGFDDTTDHHDVLPDELKLGPLADNGGPTKTHALLGGSIALDVAGAHRAGSFYRFTSVNFFGVGGAYDVVVADFDGDTLLDVAMADYPREAVTVLLGNGDGTFGAPASFDVGDGPLRLAVADLDGDEVLDLVTVNFRSSDASVLLGNGDGTFQSAMAFAVGAHPDTRPGSIAVGDFDGDDHPDLVLASEGLFEVYVLLGNGDGTFAAATTFRTGPGPSSLAVTDIDGDANLDLITSNLLGDSVGVLFGLGDGTFTRPSSDATFPVGGEFPGSMTVADLNGDAVVDVVTVNRRSEDLSVLLGDGDGGFLEAKSIAPRFLGARHAAVADLDGDAILDLVVVGEQSVSELLGDGDGGFEVATVFALGDRSHSRVVVADLDGDAMPDLVAGSAFVFGGVSVLLNQTFK